MEHLTKNQGLTGYIPGPCRVRVVSVQNADPISGYPTNVNVASGISYTVMVQTPEGMDGPYVGVRPSVPRWPSPWLVEAFPNGAILPAGILDGVIYIDAREERWAAPCEWQPGGSTGGGSNGGNSLIPGFFNTDIQPNIGDSGGIKHG